MLPRPLAALADERAARIAWTAIDFFVRVLTRLAAATQRHLARHPTTHECTTNIEGPEMIPITNQGYWRHPGLSRQLLPRSADTDTTGCALLNDLPLDVWPVINAMVDMRSRLLLGSSSLGRADGS